MAHEVAKRERQDGAIVERTQGGWTYTPAADIWEKDDEMLVYADMPGVAPEDLDIQFENGELRIHGKVPPRHEKIDFLYGEYGIGDFYRAFTIGQSIDTNKIRAELRNGVMTLHLPKTAAAKPRRIKVKNK
jgi:HSP20 family protein